MPDDRVPLSFETVRRALVREVQRTSLREVAAQTGIGRGTLHSIVRGEGKRGPYDRTYQKLLHWYLNQGQRPSEQPQHALEDTAYAILLRELPKERYSAVREEIARILHDEEARAEVPDAAGRRIGDRSPSRDKQAGDERNGED